MNTLEYLSAPGIKFVNIAASTNDIGEAQNMFV